jgi:succinoglycan biosynthesis transport protein ExoP
MHERDERAAANGGELLPARTSRSGARDLSSLPNSNGHAAEADAHLPLGRYARILSDHWRIIASVTALVTGAVAVGAAATQPAYRATGTIEIRKQASEVVPVDALFQFERISEQYLQTEYGTLRSRALLRRTFEDTVLAGRLQRAARMMPAPEVGAATPVGARLADKLHDWLIIDPLAGSRIVRVSFESPDAALSADVVNALVRQYAAMRQDAGAAVLVRLEEQGDSVRTHLLDAERELQRFVRDHGLSVVVIAGSDGETMPEERLRRLQQELTETETESYRSASQTSTLPRQSSSLESDLLKSLRERRAVLAGEYARARPTFIDSFPRMRQLRGELTQLDSLIALEKQRVTSAMTIQHEATLLRRDLLRGAVDEQRRMLDAFAASLAEYDRRQRDVEALKQLYTTLQQKQKEAALSAALSKMDIAVLDAATPPLEPVRPRPKRDIALAVVVGLLLGIALAFLLESSNTKVRTPEEVGRVTRMPLLAMIPSVPVRQATRSGGHRLSKAQAIAWHRIDAGGAQHPQLAEAFRGLRTSVLFDAGGSVPRTVLVTSGSPDEGKTTVSANFALSLAMLGYRVLLVDADLRRPSLHGVFGVPRAPGLVECLQGDVALHDVILRDVSPRLDLIVSGKDAINPSDVLSGATIQSWLTKVSPAYNFVIIDAPALYINAPDARILAHAVDGVLLVVRSGSTSRDVVRRLVAQTPNLIGIVLNQLSLKKLPAYYAAYAGLGPTPAHAQAGSDQPEYRNGH